MNQFDEAYFDAGINRVGTHCAKWDEMRRETGDPDMIPMWVADMDFPSPPAVQQALEGAVRQGTWGYTHPCDEDFEALCGYWKRRHNTDIRPDDVLMSPCVVTGLRIAVRALTREGDGLLINPPIYGPFFASIKESGRRIVESPLVQDGEGRWSLNFEEMEEKLASGEAKAVMFCSPHNPCGRVWSQEELTRLAALCAKYAAPLICDEIHADFVFAPGVHHSILTIPGGENAVMLCAASKTFNIAGLQQSAIVCRDAEKREKIAREMVACGVVSGNIFALAATRAAYTDCDAWLDGLLCYLAGNRDFAAEYAARRWPKIRVTPLDATYLMWLDCRALNLSQEELMERILKAHVKVNDGLFFGELGRGFIRLNIGCPRSQLRQALERLDAVLA